jgi:hypothetical protein
LLLDEDDVFSCCWALLSEKSTKTWSSSLLDEVSLGGGSTTIATGFWYELKSDLRRKFGGFFKLKVD